MHGSEPYLRDAGLVSAGTGERDTSLHLYRRNSCQQGRLEQDLRRIRQQEERSLRKTNREIIDLNLEQKQRKETLRRERRRSECIGLPPPPLTPLDILHSKGEHLLSRRHSSTGSNPDMLTSSSGLKRAQVRRASISTPSTLPDLTGRDSQSRFKDRPKSHSAERLPNPAHMDSSFSIQETFVDFRPQKEVLRLRKHSESSVKSTHQLGAADRTGKPPIPTSSFRSSLADSERKTRKSSQVFDRLSLEARVSGLPADKFLKVIRNRTKSLDAGTGVKTLNSDAASSL
ncbi:uncharacterized protein [Diadema antillarum]|uniref:uncharacterized protein n=1 Tax=Diadema antillarum TaxID=105358 RepID=UPI003A85F76E